MAYSEVFRPPYTQDGASMETLDQGQKRTLSFNSNPSPNMSENDLKRLRHHSLTMGLIQPTFGLPRIPDCYSSTDLLTEIRKIGANAVTKDDIKFLATKDDLKGIDNKLSAQATEINQLREEIESHSKRLKEVETELDKRTRQPEALRPNQNINGGPWTENAAELRKWNVVIEGIPKDQNDRLQEFVIDLCDKLEMTIFTQDIADITRLPRRDPLSTRPAPVLVTFTKHCHREGLLRKKFKLALTQTYSSIYINPDESPEARKRKAYYRRVAALAKQDAKEVSYRHNWILIGDDLYKEEDITKIPARYCPKDFNVADIIPPLHQRPQRLGEGARPKVYTQDPAPTAALPLRPISQKTQDLQPRPNEKIRLTKAGLLFSGPTAYLSNLSPADFVYEATPYSSTEQGIQHLNATHHLEFEIAEKVMKSTKPWEIKSLTKDIKQDLEWERMAPHKLYELNREKYDQNPELRERLIATAPHRLIEASTSQKWGGGAPFADEIYDKGIVPGHNKFGDTLTRHRDELIAKMALS